MNIAEPTQYEIEAVLKYTGATWIDCAAALRKRDNLIELAVEFIKRKDLSGMTDKEQFPKWHEYLEAVGKE